MFLKTFITNLFLHLFIFTMISDAGEPMFNETECERGAVDITFGECINKSLADRGLTKEHLRELERCMKMEIDSASFPILFSRYIAACARLKEHKRAIDFFLMLAGANQTSPHALTAKGIIAYGWWAENVLRHGLQKIDEAIALDKKAFFPRLCRATYLSYLPGEFMVAIDDFNALIETEKDNPANLYVIYSNLARIYGEHGHYDMVENINEKLFAVRSQINKKIDYPSNNERLLDKNNYSEIVQLPYPILNNTPAKKAPSNKDKQLNEHLVILEKNMERKYDDTIFEDIYLRYILLAWQYGETNRAIRFFEDLAKRHPQSPNVLAALGTITYGWRGQMVLQKGLDSIEKAMELNNKDFFAKISHATFISYFPNGFSKSMNEFSILMESENDSPKRLDLISHHINYICLIHGHDWNPAESHKEPVIKYPL